MEDRMNAGLLLVQIRNGAGNELSALHADLCKLAGVSRVSLWRNQYPDRDDWIGEWRRIKSDFEVVAVCEIDGDVDEVAKPSGLDSWLFRRAARPSQGVLRLPTLGLCMVLVSPTDATDDAGAQELRDWADFVHFPGLVDANIPGYGLATPYENVERTAPRFLHLYEFPEGDAEAVFQRTRPGIAQRFDSQPGTSAFDNWATHPLLELDYLGNFTRITVGEEARAA
jgi:hypothetical protein